jgi:peroxiredoxin Q/BCP
LDVGDEAYNFSLTDSAGRTMRLGDVKSGWYLMLVFYRGHWCTACLNQLLDLKRDYDQFTAQKTALACISVDSPETSTEFNNSWRFPFPLLSDPSLEVIDAYGARHPEGHEGKDISKPLIVIVAPNKRIVFKYLGHSPVDRPSNSDLLEWLKKHAQTNVKP